MKISTMLKLFPLLTFLALLEHSLALKCMDEDGNSVDWFIVYKLPKYSADSGKLYDGTAYLYLDAKNQQFQISPNDVNSTKSEYFFCRFPVIFI